MNAKQRRKRRRLPVREAWLARNKEMLANVNKNKELNKEQNKRSPVNGAVLDSLEESSNAKTDVLYHR